MNSTVREISHSPEPKDGQEDCDETRFDSTGLSCRRIRAADKEIKAQSCDQKQLCAFFHHSFFSFRFRPGSESGRDSGGGRDAGRKGDFGMGKAHDVSSFQGPLESDVMFSPTDKENLHGRRQIFTGTPEITRENVAEELQAALAVHAKNREEEIYLDRYMRGIQPVLNRTKKYDDEINNKIVINLANQIVNFKASEFAGEPILFVSRSARKPVPKKVGQVNDMMISEGKQTKDLEMAKRMFICGVGYRLTIHDQGKPKTDYLDEAPFEIYIPDPWNTFVVRYNDVSRRVVMGVTYVCKDGQNKKRHHEYTVYTPNVTYTLTDEHDLKVTGEVRHNFGLIPLVEYPCNSERMGAFEVVLPLLDAYNLAASDRQDAIDAFVQALLVFDGIDVNEEALTEMKALGAVKLPPAQGNVGGGGRRLYYLNEQLDQSQTQTYVNDMYKTILQIVGMPAQGDGSGSDSSNNGAIILKNGWWYAESRMLETQNMWKASETEFLRIVLKICDDSNALTGLKISDLEPKFWRQSYEDLLVKTQSFSTLRSAGMPSIQAFTYSHLSRDPESDAIIYDAYQEELAQRLDEQDGVLTEEELRTEERETRDDLAEDAEIEPAAESSGENDAQYGICPVCGKRFKKSYSGQVYNSIACANKGRKSRSGSGGFGA